MPNNFAHTYQVSYYGPSQIILPAADRGYPKHKRVRTSSATRAINMAMSELQAEARENGASTSKREFLILEVKVVA